MVTIQEYVVNKLEDLSSRELADKLGISISMISSYKKSFNPSLSIALKVYKQDGIVLHPFAKESLEYELKGRKK